MLSQADLRAASYSRRCVSLDWFSCAISSSRFSSSPRIVLTFLICSVRLSNMSSFLSSSSSSFSAYSSKNSISFAYPSIEALMKNFLSHILQTLPILNVFCILTEFILNIWFSWTLSAWLAYILILYAHFLHALYPQNWQWLVSALPILMVHTLHFLSTVWSLLDALCNLKIPSSRRKSTCLPSPMFIL